MQITIDTQKDSRAEIKKIVDLLNEILGEETKEEKEMPSPTPISIADKPIEKQITEDDSDEKLLKDAPKIEIIDDEEDLLGNKITHHEKKKEKKGAAQDILDATRFFSDDDSDKDEPAKSKSSKDQKKKDPKLDSGIIVY